MRGDRGVWNSFITVPNFTNLTMRRDRSLLAIIVGKNKCQSLIFVRVYIFMGHAVVQLNEELRLRVRFPMTSKKFYVTLIFRAAL